MCKTHCSFLVFDFTLCAIWVDHTKYPTQDPCHVHLWLDPWGFLIRRQWKWHCRRALASTFYPRSRHFEHRPRSTPVVNVPVLVWLSRESPSWCAMLEEIPRRLLVQRAIGNPQVGKAGPKRSAPSKRWWPVPRRQWCAGVWTTICTQGQQCFEWGQQSIQKNGKIQRMLETANSTTAQQHNSTTAQQHNSTTAQQHKHNSTTAQQHNSTTAQQHNSTTAQQHNRRTQLQHTTATHTLTLCKPPIKTNHIWYW